MSLRGRQEVDLLFILYFLVLIGILIKLNKITNRLDLLNKQNEIVIRQNQELMQVLNEDRK